MIYFTSDTHFFHRNIIDFCNRPFKDAEEMNVEMIKRWNERVEPSDSVYFLGDFSFGNKENTESVLYRLNGHKHLIVGNHDRKGRASDTDWALHFNSVQDYMRLKLEGMKFVLCHFPFASWERGYVNLHGHTHGKSPKLYGRLDVGVDSHNFYPITAGEAYSQALKHKDKADY